MPSIFVVQRTLLPLQSVALGRFVVDLNNPLSDFIDPKGSERPETSVQIQNDFEQMLEACSASSINSSIFALIGVKHEKGAKDIAKITAKQALTYELVNTQAWFAEVCSLVPVRTWLEGTIERGQAVYLVTGYQSVTDAEVLEESLSMKSIAGNIQASVPFGASMDLVPPAGPNPLEAGIAGNQGENEARRKKTTTPGEQIYAINYQKIRFKWFSSRSVETSYLKKGTKWKTYWGVRSDEDEEDVVEAELEDKFEIKASCEQYFTSDGRKEYVLFD